LESGGRCGKLVQIWGEQFLLPVRDCTPKISQKSEQFTPEISQKLSQNPPEIRQRMPSQGLVAKRLNAWPKVGVKLAPPLNSVRRSSMTMNRTLRDPDGAGGAGGAGGVGGGPWAPERVPEVQLESAWRSLAAGSPGFRWQLPPM
jgi:hypothetical protein